MNQALPKITRNAMRLTAVWVGKIVRHFHKVSSYSIVITGKFTAIRIDANRPVAEKPRIFAVQVSMSPRNQAPVYITKCNLACPADIRVW